MIDEKKLIEELREKNYNPKSAAGFHAVSGCRIKTESIFVHKRYIIYQMGSYQESLLNWLSFIMVNGGGQNI